VCLIARYFEAKGLPTLILGSGLDILQAGQPPRAKFVNYPLGFESGRFQDTNNQYEVVKSALQGFETMTSPQIDLLPFEWQAGWDMLYAREQDKHDQRSERDTTPQYQTEEDRAAAEQSPLA
jgi:hypothetical protein